jgi:dynein light chain LC8-type
MEMTKSLADTCAVSEEMQTRVIEICAGALDKYNVEKDVAMYIKKEFDRLYGTTWHCVVGKKCVMSSCAADTS